MGLPQQLFSEFSPESQAVRRRENGNDFYNLDNQVGLFTERADQTISSQQTQPLNKGNQGADEGSDYRLFSQNPNIAHVQSGLMSLNVVSEEET